MPDPTVMVITGTSKGIGYDLAKYYAINGYHVYGCSRGPRNDNLKNYHHFQIDVIDEVAVRKMFAEIRRTHGKLDVLINNAGITAPNLAIITPLSKVQELFNINLGGTFLFSREAAKLMQKNNYGRIVNFTSVAVPLKVIGESIYAASKSAVVTFTQILAKELAPYNITVNALGPNLIDTNAIKNLSEERRKNILQCQAIHRLGELPDITNVIDFFIKSESDFITGQVIYLGGI